VAHKERHLAELLKLPADERLEAANALFDSLDADSDSADWEQIWTAELNARLAGLLDGSRQAVPARDVLAEARARLAQRGT
jgi:putative addiction module component (TIGR02574 family)